jgi:dihydroxyacid dehydratase/phosphogluconate dehydratase
MKPSAMLYRNLLAMEVEEYLRSYPIDGVDLTANCDKSVPGALMGAFSANLPTLMFTVGARLVPVFQGKRVGTGMELWRKWAQFRARLIQESEWKAFESCLDCGLGSCNTMGTASSVAIMLEAGLCPDRILSDASFRNAARVLHACDGSTNAIIHLLAISGRTGSDLTFDQISPLGRDIPVLANVEPSGGYLIQDFHDAGGLSALMKIISSLLELDAGIFDGSTWSANLPGLTNDRPAIRTVSNPIREHGAFSTVKGSLAPSVALIKTSAASERLLKQCGVGIVFYGYEDLIPRIDDPALGATADSVLMLAGWGAVGMPEWGMIAIPKYLAEQGVEDMVRITDARMSGTSFGTYFLHVSPEAAGGGPLGFVREGDMVSLDVSLNSIELEVGAAELEIRKSKWNPEHSAHLRGWPALYQQHVKQPEFGCDFDFLRGSTPELRRFVPPVVGRS